MGPLQNMKNLNRFLQEAFQTNQYWKKDPKDDKDKEEYWGVLPPSSPV